MGVKVPIDYTGALVGVGVAAAGVKWAADRIGEALSPQQARIAALKADADARIVNSGVKPVYLKP